MPGDNQGQAAVIDEIFQQFDPATNTLFTAIAPNTARLTNIDYYVETSGLIHFPREIVGGEVDLTFSPDLTAVPDPQGKRVGLSGASREAMGRAPRVEHHRCAENLFVAGPSRPALTEMLL